MPGVTISAGYGAGGSIIAPEVASQLGLPLLDRAISSDVAAQLQVSVGEAEGGALKRSGRDRFLSLLAPLAGGVLGAGTDCAPPEAVPVLDDAAFFRDQAELIMRQAMENGAVILGRGGGAAFRSEPGVLRVRLFGPASARAAQAGPGHGSGHRGAPREHARPWRGPVPGAGDRGGRAVRRQGRRQVGRGIRDRTPGLVRLDPCTS